MTVRPTERSKLPATTTQVSPIETRALTIIENSTLLPFEMVAKYGEAKEKPIPVRMMTMIVPQRRSSRIAADSPVRSAAGLLAVPVASAATPAIRPRPSRSVVVSQLYTPPSMVMACAVM